MDKHTAANKGKGRFNREAWSGKYFYERLEEEFGALGATTYSYIEQWMQDYGSIAWPTKAWVTDFHHAAPVTWPCNFGLRLTGLMLRELYDLSNGKEINSHVHVVHARPVEETTLPLGAKLPPEQSVIRMTWRKEIPRDAPPKCVMLDATGDSALLSRILGRPVTQLGSLDMEFPPTPLVYQCWGVHVGRITAEHFLGDGRTIINVKYRKLLKEELGQRKTAGRARKVGIITFKSLVPDAINALKELGYHYSEDVNESEVVIG